jgi:hypothetical protein
MPPRPNLHGQIQLLLLPAKKKQIESKNIVDLDLEKNKEKNKLEAGENKLPSAAR